MYKEKGFGGNGAKRTSSQISSMTVGGSVKAANLMFHGGNTLHFNDTGLAFRHAESLQRLMVRNQSTIDNSSKADIINGTPQSGYL